MTTQNSSEPRYDPVVIDTVHGIDIVDHHSYYAVGTWTFDIDDDGLLESEAAIAAWTAWRDYLKGKTDAESGT